MDLHEFIARMRSSSGF